MTRCPHPLLRYPLAFLFVVAAWFLLVPALDMPVQELQGNVLLSLRATAALTALAACYYLCYLPRLYVNRTDMYAILFLGWVTAGRFLWPGLASAVRYDELLQAAMLYAALRIIFTAERRTMTLLLMLLCVLGIYEAWVGIRQIYGFAQSNHGLFRITGTLFNPGPYAGFIAPVFVCAAACVARYRFAERALRTWGSLRRLRAGVLLWGVAPYLLGWVAALMTVVVLPASMSRAALAVATAVKRLYPQNMVFTYQGDGDLSAIGTAESIHAAARGENVVAVYINNAIYGMTGGQMAPTTLLGMKTATTPYGRDPRLNGYPYKIAEMMAHLDGATYITRQSVHTAANVRKCKKAIRKAFENSMAGNGFSLVEVVSTCNSGWKLSPVASNQWLAENMLPFYPLGDIKDVKKE